MLATTLQLVAVAPALQIIAMALAALLAIIMAVAIVYASLYRKVKRGTAMIRTGIGGTRIEFNGLLVIPIFHRVETMDISLKRVEIDRSAQNGLICKDNMRADIKVAFFVRVNNVEDDVLRVAQAVGCERASSEAERKILAVASGRTTLPMSRPSMTTPPCLPMAC